MSSTGTGARDQVRRLLALVPYLQTREAVSIKDVAADFGVSEQRIRRDLKLLWFCGLPGLGMGDLIDINMEALEAGEEVIKLSNADYLTRPLRLDSTEASALMVALRTLREGSTDDEREIVDGVLAKIADAAGEVGVAPGQVSVLLPRSARRVREHQVQLERAVRQGKQVRLRYYVPARDEATDRVVDPVSLGSQEGQDYLDGWCHEAGGQRLFRLDRILEVEILDSPAESVDLAPRDLAEGIFQPSPDDILVTLDLSPSARWVSEYYPMASVTDLGERALRVTLHVGDPAWLVRLMLRVGAEATLVEPAELRMRVSQVANRALANYAHLGA